MLRETFLMFFGGIREWPKNDPKNPPLYLTLSQEFTKLLILPHLDLPTLIGNLWHFIWHEVNPNCHLVLKFVHFPPITSTFQGAPILPSQHYYCV